MSNHFCRITSEGGYFGRFFWANSNSRGQPEDWGTVQWLPNCRNLEPDSGWAGAIWVLRLLT